MNKTLVDEMAEVISELLNIVEFHKPIGVQTSDVERRAVYLIMRY